MTLIIWQNCMQERQKKVNNKLQDLSKLREFELLPGPMSPYLVQSVVCRNNQSILHVWYLKKKIKEVKATFY